MSLGWRDAAATLATVAAMTITYARVKGYDWPLLGSWRMGTLAVLILGFGACIAAGTGAAPTKDGWTIAASILGGGAAVLGLIGLVAGSKLAFLLLAADIVLLWAVSTVHHLLAKGA